jgi:hypothetical protein
MALMAKAKPPRRRRRPTGPYLAAAFLAEWVLAEADGVVSITRIVDRIALQPVGISQPSLPGGIQALFKVVLFLSWKTGGKPGSYVVNVELTNPKGETSGLMGQVVELVDYPPTNGANLIFRLQLGFEPGLYWFDVYLDDRFVTAVPMEVLALEPEPQSPKLPAVPAD